MDSESQIATVYVWGGHHSNFDMDYVLWALKGREAPTEEELTIMMLGKDYTKPFHPVYYTKEFIIHQRGKSSVKSRFPKGDQALFSTVLLEERLEKLGLSLPEHELTFIPRKSKGYEGVDLAKVGGLAFHLMESLNARNVLAVNGTDIENSVLYASPEIEEKVSSSILV